MTEFATEYCGTGRAKLNQPLRDVVRNRLHMITVDSASDEVSG